MKFFFRFSSSSLVVLQSLQTEYERILNLKNELEKQLEERSNELKTTKTVANSFTNQLKEKLEQMSVQKVCFSFDSMKRISTREQFHL